MPHVGNFPQIARWNPLSIPPSAFTPRYDNQDWQIFNDRVENRANLTIQYYVAPAYFPQGATLKKLTLYGYRDDAVAVMSLILYRVSNTGVTAIIGQVLADWSDGFGSKSVDLVANNLVDNETYSYDLVLTLDPNDDVADVNFRRGQIEWD